MHVIFVILRKIVVEYRFHVVHVNPSGGHIRRHQNVGIAVPEPLHYPVPLHLLEIAVKSLRKIPPVLELQYQLVHLLLCIAEDQRQLGRVEIQKPAKHLVFVLRPHFIIVLLDIRYRQFFFHHFYVNRLPLIQLGNLHDCPRHCGGKQYGLPVPGRIFQYRLDVLPEAHVQHLVGLIQHHRMKLLKAERMPSHMIHHATRCSDDDLHSSLERTNLPADILSPVNREHFDSMQIFGQIAEFFRHLNRQFSRRAQHKSLQFPVVRINLLQKRDSKGRRLSRPCLRLSDHIRSGPHHRYGLRLNRRHFLKSHIFNRPEKLRTEIQFFKS